MRRFGTIIIACISLLFITTIKGDDRMHVVIYHSGSVSSIPVDSIKVIQFDEVGDAVRLLLNDDRQVSLNNVKEGEISNETFYTLYINYNDDKVTYMNPRADVISIVLNDSNADVLVKASKLNNLHISISGKTNNGRLCVESDSAYTLHLNDVSIKSQHASAFNSLTNAKVNVHLEKGTENVFADTGNYLYDDSAETLNGCFNSMGHINFDGEGTLTIEANNKHALYSKKGIRFDGGKYIVQCSSSDAVHTGKYVIINDGSFQFSGLQGDGFDIDDEFTMNGGTINLNITGVAAKGIKCKGNMTINEGIIDASASGALKNKNGELSYCTILKSDSEIIVNGGHFYLTNSSKGGKCISSDKKMTIAGGVLQLETTGDGEAYANSDGETDYFTSKCIASDDTLRILRGEIKCKSIGVGGKGIVSDDVLYLGEKNQIDNDALKLDVETFGHSIVNDVINDVRCGCPKAVKSNWLLYVFSGTIRLKTHGMGGEGIEANSMKVRGGDVICETFDDGINVEESFDMSAGKLYCNSIDNDGIDSNGQIKIKGGDVFAVSQHIKNEPFDSEGGKFYISGGRLFGISRQDVYFASSTQPIFADDWLTHFPIKKDVEYSIADLDGNVLYSFVSPYDDEYCRMIVSLPEFEEGQVYYLIDDEYSTPQYSTSG